MKFRMTKTLRFWVEAAYEENDSTGTKAELMANVLCEFEEAGEAMRYLRVDGRIGWKATRLQCCRGWLMPNRRSRMIWLSGRDAWGGWPIKRSF
jgi:hypothetical protein